MINIRGTLGEFIQDIEPFFYGKRMTYVDVGAFTGGVYDSIVNSNLSIREAHLFEPNPASYTKLQVKATALNKKNVHLYNVAVGKGTGSLRLKPNEGMSSIIHDDSENSLDYVEVKSTSLDELAKELTENRISLLKIDVEGYELDVLKGAKDILSNQNVDMIYIEAGMSKNGVQQCYYRDIDDVLEECGYKVFRIYEQMFEWIEDSPLLRRVNIAYMSSNFAEKNPFRLVNEIYELKIKLSSMGSEITRFKNLSEKLEKYKEQSESELNDKDKSIVNLNLLLDKAGEENKTNTDVLNKSFRSEIEKFKVEIESLKQSLMIERKESQIGIEARDIEIEKYKVETDVLNKSFKSEIEELQVEIETLNQSLMIERKENQVRIKALGEEINIEREKYKDIKQRVEDYSVENKQLKTNIDELKLRCTEITADAKCIVDRKNTELSLAKEKELILHNDFLKYKKEAGKVYSYLKKSYLEIEKLEDKILRINNYLTYRIGKAVINNTASFKDWIKIPAAVFVANKEFKEKKKFNTELLGKKFLRREFDLNESCFTDKAVSKVEKASDVILHEYVPPKAIDKAIIKQAHEIMRDGYLKEGLEFSEKYASGNQKNSIYLLKANADIENDNDWLDCLNNYIKSFDVGEISLDNAGKSKFLSIKNDLNYSITDGPLVSIIMPAYNAEKYIELSVKSILNQTWESLELIIVDDCSSDNTWDIISTLSKRDKRIKLLKNKVNVGPYVSKNYALNIATGDFITGHDSDDFAFSKRIENHMSFMLNHPRVKASTANKLRMRNDGLFVNFTSIQNSKADGAAGKAFISCMFESKFLKNKIGSWDCVRFGADGEVINRAKIILGDDFVELDQLAMICLDSEESLTNHPDHGISKTTGLSPVRKYYLDQYRDWHSTLSLENCYLEFPKKSRPFAVKPASEVSYADIIKNIDY